MHYLLGIRGVEAGAFEQAHSSLRLEVVVEGASEHLGDLLREGMVEVGNSRYE
ncbi:hypothetical protein [Rhodococcus rhodochrous]|uniref:hypothetical protein n=1 Tax=Rhodococcus rhodochrous TaxID=1829 RepID=UPI00036706A1|nr:hypothetical protein [Rhodococcus rhodochrous]